MTLALTPGEHFFDVVETAYEAGAEIEALRAEWSWAPPGLAERVQPCPKDLVHDVFERDAPLSSFPLESDSDVVVYGQRCTHILMLQL